MQLCLTIMSSYLYLDSTRCMWLLNGSRVMTNKGGGKKIYYMSGTSRTDLTLLFSWSKKIWIFNYHVSSMVYRWQHMVLRSLVVLYSDSLSCHIRTVKWEKRGWPGGAICVPFLVLCTPDCLVNTEVNANFLGTHREPVLPVAVWTALA